MKKCLFIMAAMLLHLSMSTGASAQTDTTSWYFPLDSVIHSGFRPNSPLRGNLSQGLSWDQEMMEKLPKFLGYTDPLRYIQLFPGVQTTTEYDSGIHIQGFGNQHNDIAINGVPLYGVNHLFGLFSVFNSGHFKKTDFSHVSWYYDSNRLGGNIDMVMPLQNIDTKADGEFSIGVMSAQGTLKAKTGKNSTLILSARQAYINLLYRSFLRIGGDPIRYGFGDYNLTWLFAPTSNDRIWIDAYFGYDKASTASSRIDNLYQNVMIKWGNAMGALHWKHDFNNGAVLTQSIFGTGYRTVVDFSQTEINLYLPSSILNSGYKAHLDFGNWNTGIHINYYNTHPQDPHVTGGDFNSGSQQYSQRGVESSAYAGYRHMFGYGWMLETGVKASVFTPIVTKDIPEASSALIKKAYWGITPMLSIGYDFASAGKLTATFSTNQQYLYQSGVSNLGLPIEFWFTVGEYNGIEKRQIPQYAAGADIGYELTFRDGMYAISANAYYKRIYNQMEYRGDLFDLVTDNYNLNDYLLHGNGHNFGVNMLMHKRSGDFTGWVSYAFGRSIRTFDEPGYNDGWYPSNYERLHELSVVGSYQYRRWNFGATFVCASGTPFTGTESYYTSSGRVIAVYGRYNGCRMRPYIRLDLNVNVDIVNNDKMRNGFSFSLFNALGRRNDTGYRLIINDEETAFAYIQNHFLLRFVPGFSYYHKF